MGGELTSPPIDFDEDVARRICFAHEAQRSQFFPKPA